MHKKHYLNFSSHRPKINPMSAIVEVKSVSCHYRKETVLEQLSFHINEGQIACLLGPSGCGKTTALRTIAGFEPVSEGEILLRGNIVSNSKKTIAPEKRKLGMVFQDYALFPHMNITGNIGFGLRKHSASKSRERVAELLAIVGLPDYQERYPHELSGGQQQRIALARALASKPDVILMDEPFSNLDVELREQLSHEVRQILKSLNTSALIVTHDQQEAFALADVIGVMRQGRILQWDTAFNLYHEPNHRFVADFVGKGVLMKGYLVSPNSVATEIGLINGNRAYTWPKGTQVDVLLRPDDVVPDVNADLKAKVVHKAFKGAEIMYTLKLPTGSKVLSLFPSHKDHNIGDLVGVRIAADHLVAFNYS